MVPPIVLAARALVLTVLLALPASNLPAQAQGKTVFGPMQFERTAGPPDLFTETFTLPTNIAPPFQLYIDHGLADGGKRVSRARLTLNGVEVVRPSEFSQQVAAIDKEVALQTGTNTLEVRLTSPPGSLLTVTITGTVTITITEPPDGAIVPEGELVVSGNVDAGGAEVGVTVNDLVAVVQGNTFVALPPVTPATTTLTAVATTASGSTASKTMGVTVTAAADPDLIVRLRPSPPGGLAPLSVAYSLVGGPVPTAVELDLDGDGAVEFSGTSLDGQTFTYLDPGLFLPTVRITDANGNQFTARAVVEVLDQAALDALLQAKWTGIKDTLRAGDVAQAVAFIHTETRPAYEAQLGQLNPVALAGIDQYMTTIQLVEVGPGGAQYEMLRDRNGQSSPLGSGFRWIKTASGACAPSRGSLFGMDEAFSS